MARGRRIFDDNATSLELRSGAVAQWLEQGTHNPWVVGSIPTGPTMLHIRPQKEKVLAPKRADFSVEQGTFDVLQ